jgi:hypothetical protein
MPHLRSIDSCLTYVAPGTPRFGPRTVALNCTILHSLGEILKHPYTSVNWRLSERRVDSSAEHNK